jgi:hypothetical protein
MIEFAAGIMVGGSIGAVIMGALLAQTRSIAGDRREAAGMQAPRQSASRSMQHRAELGMLLSSGAALAGTSAQLH